EDGMTILQREQKDVGGDSGQARAVADEHHEGDDGLDDEEGGDVGDGAIEHVEGKGGGILGVVEDGGAGEDAGVGVEDPHGGGGGGGGGAGAGVFIRWRGPAVGGWGVGRAPPPGERVGGDDGR